MEKRQVDAARKEAEAAYLIYANLKATYKEAEKDWLKKSRRFKAFDYELAQTDGRLKKIPPGGERKEKKQPELSLEQLKEIATRLGVGITVEEDNTVVEEERIEEAFNEENNITSESEHNMEEIY